MSAQFLTVLAAILSAHTVAIIALAALLSRQRERIARLEEWIRLDERLDR